MNNLMCNSTHFTTNLNWSLIKNFTYLSHKTNSDNISYISGKNNNSKPFNIYINAKRNGVMPNTKGVWKHNLINAVTSTFKMLRDCNSIISLDLSNFDASKVTDMSSMLWGCNNMTSIDFSNFNTSNVTIMSNMFYNC